MTALPPLDRKKVLALLLAIKNINVQGTRGKTMEMYCRGHREVCESVAAEIIAGRCDFQGA